jgi:CubicO group peptidase (beta-lactamase class C family)
MRCRIAARAGRALVALVLVIMLLAVMAGSAAARATSYKATIRDGRAAARALLEQSGAASLSLALVSDNRVVWQEAFGYADKATSTAPEADTMYGIGSVSKIIATVATMKLIDQGEVELDAPFTRYVPGFTMLSPAYRQITVRMLLDHSSGFPGSTYGDLSTDTYFPGYLQEVLDTLAGERLKTTPGYMSVYGNDGFTMIEALVLAVTGKTYAQYVQDEIFTPLGMDHSAFPLEPFADGSYAKAYTGDVAHPREVINLLASGGAYSTPTDLSRFATMLMNGGTYGDTRVLSAASVAEIGTDQTLLSFNPVPCKSTAFGLGWDTVTEPGLEAVGVTGWAKVGDSIDYHATFAVAPRARLAFVATTVTPLRSSSLAALGQRVLLHALVDQGTLRRLPKPLPVAAPPVKRASPARLAAMEGYWGTQKDLVLRVSVSAHDPQALDFFRLTGPDWAPMMSGLRLRTDGRFHAGGSAGGYSTQSAGGRRYLVQSSIGAYGHYRDEALMMQKLAPETPLSAAWTSRIGQTWLAVNGQPDSALYAWDRFMLLTLGDIPGLPGYVSVTTAPYGLQLVNPVHDVLGAMFLQIPGIGSRDLEDAVVEQHGAEDWVRYGSTLYRPRATVPALGAGPNTVTFGDEGYAEWRSLATAGTVQIGAGGATSWRLYGPDFAALDSGTTFPATVSAPEAGCYLLLFGPAGSSTTVTVTAD